MKTSILHTLLHTFTCRRPTSFTLVVESRVELIILTSLVKNNVQKPVKKSGAKNADHHISKYNN